MISNSINVYANAKCRVPIAGLSSPSLPLLLYEVDVLEHDGHEVAAAAANVNRDVPQAELLLSHQDSLLCHADTVGHLKTFICSVLFKIFIKKYLHLWLDLSAWKVSAVSTRLALIHTHDLCDGFWKGYLQTLHFAR